MISPWWILSTGNCAQLDDDLDHDHFVVVAGEWDLDKVDGSEQKIHVETVFTHPYFSSAEQTSDIALIRLMFVCFVKVIYFLMAQFCYYHTRPWVN